ncbi:MAG: amino acid permease [Oscillospiraceae bacterium]|nr:amino acid permease [Oscillospiraceae bacterium]
MAVQKKQVNLESGKTEFKKEIGLFSGVSIIAGIMIGTGIFLSSANALKAAYSNPLLTVLVWFIAGIVTLLAGLCYGELGASIPKAGGSYVYLTKAYGSAVGFLSGFSGFVVGSSGSIAAIAVGFTGFLGFFYTLSPVAVKVIAIGLVIILTVINCLGVKLGSIFQNITMVGKLVPLALIILIGVWISRSGANFSLANLPQNPAPGIALALIMALWGYEGWMNLNTVAEEIKNPKRNIPLSITIAIVGVTLIYTIFNFALFRILPIDTIVASQNPAGDAAKVLIGNIGGSIVAVGILISILGALNGCVLVFPRTYYAMAQEKVFFKPFGKLHPKYKTPVNALIASAVVSIIFILIGNFGQLTTMVVFSSWTFNALTIISVIILRRKYPNLERPYKVIGYPIMPIIALISIGFILFSTLTSELYFSLLGLVLNFVVGIPAYFIFRYTNKEKN